MEQIRNGGPVTITDKQMTRFIMTVEEAARLVLKSVVISRGGEVFVTKMPVVKIPDLANAMINLIAPNYGLNPSDIKTEEVGAKPGEKLYEELMSEEETHRALELKDMFVVTPAFKSIYHSITYEYPDSVSDKIGKSYISATEKPMDNESIKNYLRENKVLEKVDGNLHGSL
jgi:FlaA1/EpsC-like NDP-sugar epimerase